MSRLHPVADSDDDSSDFKRPRLSTSHAVLEIPPSELEYNEKDELGSGSYGTVYRARWRRQVDSKEEITLVAIKIMEPEHLPKNFKRKFNKEVALMCAVDDPYRVHVYGVCSQEPERMVVVMELVREGSVHSFMQQNDLSWPVRLELMVSMARAIDALHTNKHVIFHRDIKPANFLVHCERDQKDAIVDRSIRVVASDFDLANTSWTSSSSTALRKQEGTYRYSAPEWIIHGSLDYTAQCDIYSLGMSFYYVLMLREPWQGRDNNVVFTQLQNKQRPAIDLDLIPPPYREYLPGVVRKCWNEEPSGRYATVTDLISRLKQISAIMPSEELITVLMGTVGQSWAAAESALLALLAANPQLTSHQIHRVLALDMSRASDSGEARVKYNLPSFSGSNQLSPYKKEMKQFYQRYRNEVTDLELEKQWVKTRYEAKEAESIINQPKTPVGANEHRDTQMSATAADISTSPTTHAPTTQSVYMTDESYSDR